MAKPATTVHNAGFTTAHLTKMDKEDHSHSDGTNERILKASMLEAVVNIDKTCSTTEMDTEETSQCTYLLTYLLTYPLV